MAPTVADIVGLIETIAPRPLAEEWDNPGLQVGHPGWPVETVRVALDPLPEVIEEARADGVDLLVTHHPLIFKALKSIDFSAPLGAAVLQAGTGRMSIYAAHTNLDSAVGGINDILCRRIGVTDPRPLSPGKEAERRKLVVYAPSTHEGAVLAALLDAGAGRIGAYSGCSFRVEGTGTYVPDPGARPYRGEAGELVHAREVRIEAVVEADRAEQILEAVRARHPYETMAHDLYPMAPRNAGTGLGRMGRLTAPAPLAELAAGLKQAVGIENVRYVGDPEMVVESVAVCSGAGSGMMGPFLSSGAQAFITGDLRYHDARDAQAAGRGLIDIGHFPSEHIVVSELTERLRGLTEKIHPEVRITACGLEADPFRFL